MACAPALAYAPRMPPLHLASLLAAVAISSVFVISCGGDVDNPTDEAENTIPGCSWSDTHRFTLVGDPEHETVTFACLDGSLAVDAAGHAPCAVFVFQPAQPDGSCRCDTSNGRHPMDASHGPALDHVEAEFPDVAASGTCACELRQSSGPELERCQTLERASEITALDAFCYVDLASDPPVGSSSAAALCDSQAIVMLAAEPVPPEGEVFAVTCGTPACFGAR
jgi:hypothetical protein